MTTPTTASTLPTPTPKPTPPAPVKGAVLKLENLRANPEGIVGVAVEPKVEEPVTIVSSRLFLGYGGFLAIENRRGLQKAFGGDAIYDLSNGERYVVAAEMLTVLGIPAPALSKEDREIKEAEEAKAKELAKEAKEAEAKPVSKKPADTL